MVDPVWEQLPKSQTDDTTIEEAISEGIDAHNADSEAHLSENEAIEEHRTNDIIDHPAESIPNDKTFTNARAFVAILDPNTGEDYDTLESAVSAAAAAGGGNVLVTEGDHYLSSHLVIPGNVNLIGLDRDTCNIITDYSSGYYFTFSDTEDSPYLSNRFENLSFIALSSRVFADTSFTYLSTFKTYFSQCNFLGKVTYFKYGAPQMFYQDCYFDCGTAVAVYPYEYAFFDRCEIRTTLTSGTASFLGHTQNESRASVRYCYSNENDTRPINFFDGATFETTQVIGNQLRNAILTDFYAYNAQIIGNYIELWSTSYVNLEGDSIIFTGNRVTGGTGNRVRLTASSELCAVVANAIANGITDSGTDNIVSSNVII